LDSFAQLRNRRIQIRERIQRVLRIDQRVIAAWYTGSVGRGQEDAWSDFDLVLAIRDDAFRTFWDNRLKFYESIDSTIFVQRELPGNSILPGGSFQLVVYEGPGEVDWTIGPASQATRPIETRLLFDRVNIPVSHEAVMSKSGARVQAAAAIESFWAMAPIAVKYAARRNTAAAIRQAEFLEQSIRQLNMALLALASDFQPLTIANLQETITPVVALNYIESLCDIVDGARPFLTNEWIATPHEMSIATHKLIALVRNLIVPDSG